jgi:hypothetical protein
MAPPTQPQDRSDSRNQDDESQEREPVQLRRTASTNDLNHDNLPQAIRLADGPGSGHMLVNRERLSENVRGTSPWTQTPLGTPHQLEEVTQISMNQRMSMMAVTQRQRAAATSDSDAPQENTSSRERTGVSEATLEPRLALARGQRTPLNSTQQVDQPGHPRSYMPSLRSQPEFYMTGVTAVDTTAEPLADSAECTICLEPLSDDVVKFRTCGHMFHTVCVQSWFDQSAPRTGSKRGTCPNCRYELYEPDPQYGHTAPPPQSVERPVMTDGQRRFALAPSDRESPSRREEAIDTTERSNNDLRNEFIADFQRRLAEQQLNTGARQAPAVTPQRQATTRRPRGTPRTWAELTHGYQLPRTDALERARYDSPAHEDTAGLPPRTSSLPHGGATRRQQASQIMTDAIRVTASPGNSHSEDERVDPHTSDHVPNVDESPRVPSILLDQPNAPTSTVNRHPIRPRESRATLAARAIAQRRPLELEPGLNNRDADPSQPIQRPALNSQRTSSDRSRNSLRVPDSHGHRLVIVPQHDLTPARRSTRDLQNEQNSLLDRLREVQNQIGRNLQEADTLRERRATVMLRPAPDHLPPDTQDDLSTRRPPPIAIPHLADPAVSDLRSAREFPDPRVMGSEISIWSAGYVTSSRRDTQTQAPRTRQFSLILSHLQNVERANALDGEPNNNDQTPSYPRSTHSETSSAEQSASTDDQRSVVEDRQLTQDLSRQLDDTRRLMSMVPELRSPSDLHPPYGDAPDALL